ncbi:uncharacterized protein TNCV_608971 [Trichonephila clavipes]|nr:uncharacterized protein TNCV_608971 [Trichonephila clavipes]
MMNSTESAKRPSGKRPKKRKFTGNMHTRCKDVHSVDESLNNSASGKKIQLQDVDSSFIEHDDGFDGYRVGRAPQFEKHCCKGCDSWKGRKGSPADKKWKILHVKECLKNHNGSAGLMETVGMVRIFQRSLSHRSVRYTSFIGDGDSKTFASITASNQSVWRSYYSFKN